MIVGKYNNVNKPLHHVIIGGGIAGLGVGFYAKKCGIPFTLYEANNWIGGNCITFNIKTH